jgi:hypothetical protein
MLKEPITEYARIDSYKDCEQEVSQKAYSAGSKPFARIAQQLFRSTDRYLRVELYHKLDCRRDPLYRLFYFSSSMQTSYSSALTAIEER